jgi:cytochrome c oxidase cbb3-type subunit IV
MDLMTFRTLSTVLLFAIFLGIVAWAWSGRRQAAFDEAARLPLDDDEAGADGARRAGS